MQTVYLGSVEHADGYNGATAIAHVCHDGEEFLAVYPHGWHTVSVNSPAVRGIYSGGLLVVPDSEGFAIIDRSGRKVAGAIPTEGDARYILRGFDAIDCLSEIIAEHDEEPHGHSGPWYGRNDTNGIAWARELAA